MGNAWQFNERVKPITVWWYARSPGRLGERRQVTLTLAECTALDIWQTQPISPWRLPRLIRMRGEAPESQP